jgi:two-component system cell cycle response regulator
MPHTQLETGRLLAERIRIAVSASPFGIGVLDPPLAITVSIGLAEYWPRDGHEDPESAAQHLMARADKALYEAKAAGRNAVVLAAA